MKGKAPRPAPPDTILFRAEEAAFALNVGRDRVFQLIRLGELHSVKIGGSRRVPREAIDAYIKHLADSQPAGRTA